MLLEPLEGFMTLLKADDHLVDAFSRAVALR